MSEFEKRESYEIDVKGKKVFGIFHRPSVKGKLPTVIFCHGMMGSKVGPNKLYVQLSELLTRAGIAVFRFDRRGCGDSEGEPEELAISDAVDDIQTAVKFVKEKIQGVDASRLALFGSSFGGALAVKAAAKLNDIKYLVLWAALFHAKDWEDKWKHANSGNLTSAQETEMRRFNGILLGKEFYRELFTMDLSVDIKKLNDKPWLLIHGEADETVPYRHMQLYCENREESSDSKYVTLKNTDHAFSNLPERRQAFEETVVWLQNHFF